MGVAVTPPPRPLALALRATRPLYLPTSVLPALAGALVAVGSDAADWWALPLVLLATLLVHAGVNATNDVEDWARGVDSPDKMDNSRVFSTGLMTVEAGRRLYAALFLAAFAIGLLLCALQTWWLLAYGLAGILGGWLYTGGPRPYKYDGLGDPAIVWLMGPLLTQGAYTAVTGDAFHAPAFWVGLFPGLLITAVLQANNLSDIEGDRAAGVRTLAVRIGFARARVLFLATFAAAFLVLPVLVAAGLFSAWVLLPLLTLPLALPIGAAARAARASGDEVLVTLAPRTAQLHL
ncbi:MAG TPA: 1,4-dihydroxy-2-naphthoate octaprenyltransferase, partial [Solirubrobacteraceae bacterium]|nr:1,4-dihydroxy-2-naphthoate octaprenyltransferase [Solirubrobacteraceae bacterium]